MKKGWIFVAAIAAWALALCFLVGCGKNADDATDQNGTEKQSAEQTDAVTEANPGETADAVVTIGDKTFLLKNDADLNGLPLRVVVSPKGLKNGTVEISKRDKSYMDKVDKDNALNCVKQLVASMLEEINNI